jgi:hypothetical protein
MWRSAMGQRRGRVALAAAAMAAAVTAAAMAAPAAAPAVENDRCRAAPNGQAASAPPASATENGQREAPLARAAVLPTAATRRRRRRHGRGPRRNARDRKKNKGA